ncbi:hypothetical protein, partial [Xanthomonas fragariae]|uniref:hypothetical protein n=1 Tax=Xanthomonas fragariae TaxID=48664 RepID=UPI001F2E64AF
MAAALVGAELLQAVSVASTASSAINDGKERRNDSVMAITGGAAKGRSNTLANAGAPAFARV